MSLTLKKAAKLIDISMYSDGFKLFSIDCSEYKIWVYEFTSNFRFALFFENEELLKKIFFVR